MMTRLVIHVLNMSFAAGCTAFLVIVLGWLFRRLPKGYSYALWLAVLFRFLCPVVFHGPVSLLPVNPEPVRQEIIYETEPKIQTGVIWVDRAVNDSVMESLAPESRVQSANPIQIVLAMAGLIWIAGMAAFFLYHAAQYGALKKRLSTAVRAAEYETMTGRQAVWRRKQDRHRNSVKTPVPVRVSDQIGGAFVLGIVHPVIYLPSGMEETAVPMILRHEMAHVRRRDGLVKLLWLAAVMIHWFNPLAWLSFRLMSADMEMSCDEQALYDCSMEERKGYSKVLLAEAERQSQVLLPLAFGKNSSYQRIRNILNYRRPRASALVLGGILLAAAGFSLMVSPQPETDLAPDRAASLGNGRGSSPGGKLDSGMNGSSDSSPDSGDVGEAEDGASVAVIGGADGPASIFIAGKLGDASGRDEMRRRPEAGWLASVPLKWQHTGDLGIQESRELQESQEFQEFQKSQEFQEFQNSQESQESKESQESQELQKAEEELEGAAVFLDLATEETVIFHGAFGLFAFERDDDGYWRQSLFLSDAEAVDRMAESLHGDAADKSGTSGEGIRWEERFISSFDSGMVWSGQDLTGRQMADYDARKMADGRIAVLGANPSGTAAGGRLIDLWYGYYDPQEQVMTQAYLFLGDGKEFENYKGDIGECRYLFSRNDYDYFLRTPQSFLEFEQPGEGKQRSFHLPYDRLELVRSRDAAETRKGMADDSKGGSGKGESGVVQDSEEVLDRLVCMQTLEHQKIVLTEERIVYTAAAEADNISFKNPGLVSIRLDGSDRRVARIPYQVYNGLSYDDGYLYYEGWTNAGAFPRPLYRMRPDFTAQEKIGELAGSLIAVQDGGVCWQMDWNSMRIMVGSVKKPGELRPYLADGEQGRHARCHMERIDDITLQVVITPLELTDSRNGDELEIEETEGGLGQVFYLMIPAGAQVE